MKVKKVSKKISLNKSTVSNLNDPQMEAVQGGYPVPLCTEYTCGPCKTNYCSITYCTYQPSCQG